MLAAPGTRSCKAQKGLRSAWCVLRAQGRSCQSWDWGRGFSIPLPALALLLSLLPSQPRHLHPYRHHHIKPGCKQEGAKPLPGQHLILCQREKLCRGCCAAVPSFCWGRQCLGLWPLRTCGSSLQLGGGTQSKALWRGTALSWPAFLFSMSTHTHTHYVF